MEVIKTTVEKILKIVNEYTVFESVTSENIEKLIYSDIPLILEATKENTKLKLVYNSNCAYLRNYQDGVLESIVLRSKKGE